MKKILIALLFFGFFWCGFQGISIWTILGNYTEKPGRIELYDRFGELITQIPQESGFAIPFTGNLDIPLIDEIILTEDRRFWKHHGIDIIGKLGALEDNYNAGNIVRGGSTITEQLIKNKYFPNAPRTLIQKGREAIWASILELKSEKDDILREYIDSVYMGNGIYGVETARLAYFRGDSLKNLSDTERLEIITRIKYPNLAKGYEKYLSLLTVRFGKTIELGSLPKREKPKFVNIFPLFTERILQEKEQYCNGEDNTIIHFLREIPSDICEKNDIILKTTLDKTLNESIEDIVEGTIAPLETKNVSNASVYVWSEREKKVIIYIGNRTNGRENSIDMITRRRSVGSTLKPFIYLMALEKGADMNSLVLDESKPYDTENKGVQYVPENYIPQSYGPISLREALGNSLNSSTVRLSEHLGIGRIYDYFRSVGLDLDHDSGYYGYSISLGGVELSLENMISGYRSLTDLTDIDKYLLYESLKSKENRAQTFGINSILNTSIPLAVKTGTSSNFRDNWTVGYNNTVIIGVWIGNTNNDPMNDVSGITGAGPIYHRVTEELIRSGYIDDTPLVIPPGIRFEYICQDRNCLSKQGVYQKEMFSSKSRPRDGIFFEEDFFTPLTEDEKEKWKIKEGGR